MNNFNYKKTCDKCKKKINIGNFNKHACLNDDDKIIIQNLYVNQNLTFKDIVNKGYRNGVVKLALKGKKRSASLATKLARKSHSESFKWSDASKKQMSKHMKRLYKDGKIKRWNISRRNKSYAEQKFYDFLISKNYKYEDDFFTEFPFGLFRADFYFPKKSLVIEIDGKQHKNRKENDKRKDEFINSKNICVFRIIWRAMCHDSKEQFYDIEQILMKPDRQIMIQFTEAQLKKLNQLDEYKTQKSKNLQLKKQQILNRRLQDVNVIEKKRGWMSRLSIKWGVSCTQVRRFLKLNNLIEVHA
jgi:very-short-patch-repair endonuclease